MASSRDDGDQVPATRLLDELFRAHHDAVVSFVRRRAAPENVDDVVAETFLVAWRRLADIPVDSPLPWLLGVARNVVATQRRGGHRRDALYRRLQDAPNEAVDRAKRRLKRRLDQQRQQPTQPQTSRSLQAKEKTL